jgi:hypothetical protein
MIAARVLIAALRLRMYSAAVTINKWLCIAEGGSGPMSASGAICLDVNEASALPAAVLDGAHRFLR